MGAASRHETDWSLFIAPASERAAPPPVARPPAAYLAEADELSIPHPSPARALQTELAAAFAPEDAQQETARAQASGALLVLGLCGLAFALGAVLLV